HCGHSFSRDLVGEQILEDFPASHLLALHYLTLGLFSMVWINIFHGSLPKRQRDDPSACRAAGFLFIPIYSLYWHFFTHLRLCERLNEECQRHGLPGTTSPALVLCTCIVHLIPFLNLVSWLVLYPLMAISFQTQMNELAEVMAAPWERSPSARFCPRCECGNPTDALYCGSCGAPLAKGTPRNSPDGMEFESRPS
ncbi:MAG: zinc ribbon domain-containing protein, partial [Armatimonadetes bacterium]|nr:zinc ribbon domain-containing protein [Armatimonadota bacterium]